MLWAPEVGVGRGGEQGMGGEGEAGGGVWRAVECATTTMTGSGGEIRAVGRALRGMTCGWTVGPGV